MVVPCSVQLYADNWEDFIAKDTEARPYLEVDHPDKKLFEIGAVDTEHRLTPIGRRLARMPVDPRIGRMILAAEDEGCLQEILIIAAAFFAVGFICGRGRN